MCQVGTPPLDWVLTMFESLKKPAPPMVVCDDPEEHEALIAEALEALDRHCIFSAQAKYETNNRCTARCVARLCAVLPEAGRIEDISRVGEVEKYRDEPYMEFGV